MLDEGLLAEAKAALVRLISAQRDVDRARADYHHGIRRLHAAGASMREIAEALGISHQRVHQIVDEEPRGRRRPPGRRRRGRGAFQRFTDPAREVMVAAQDEARALGHDELGGEHLLLALVAGDRGLAGTVLRELGVELEGARGAVRSLFGAGAESAAEELPFGAGAKKALELALRESLRLGHDFIGTEHLLLALTREDRTAEVLTSLGADPVTVRSELERVLAA